MSAEQGDAERFAAADEQGRSAGSVTDPRLVRDLAVAAMLRSRGPDLAPRADERDRVRARVLAELVRTAGPQGPHEQGTVPLGAVLRPAFPLTVAASLADAAPATLPHTRTPDGGATATVQLSVLPATEPATDKVPTTEDEPDTAPVAASIRRGRHVPAGRPGRRSDAAGPRRMALHHRAILVAAAALLVIVATAGGVLASRDALPGDPLYGMKRAAESVGDALTLGDTARAERKLDSATTRLDEVQTLVTRGPATPDTQLLQSAIQDFDSSTGAGSRSLLTSQDAGGPTGLSHLQTWASDQVARFSTLRTALPSDARSDVDGSITLLDRLVARTEALAARSSCTDLTSGTVDDLGPLPATGTCTPVAVPTGTRTASGGARSGAARSSVPARSGRAAPTASDQAGTDSAPADSDEDTSAGGSDGDVDGDGDQPTGDGASTTGSAAAPSTTTTVKLPRVPPIPHITLPHLPGRTRVTIG